MKKVIVILSALVSAAVGGTTSFAGGGGAEFASRGVPLLEQSPALLRLLSNNFAVEDSGRMGPSDAPFDGGKLYTYMDFRARSKDSDGQSFLIRLHFDRGKNSLNYAQLSFKRMEIFPVPASSVTDLKTFSDLYEATGANNTADSTAYSRESP